MLPEVDLGSELEEYLAYEPAASCDGQLRPGVVEFRDFVMDRLGGSDLGMVRACTDTRWSLHHEGRAWDWGMRADRPDDVARVQELLDWLYAADRYGNVDALVRRAGLVNVIWNGQSWSSTRRLWHEYSGPNPHTDHVHFGFAWPAALAQTSFYGWLGAGAIPAPGQPAPFGALNAVGLVAVGAGVLWLGSTVLGAKKRRA